MRSRALLGCLCVTIAACGQEDSAALTGTSGQYTPPPSYAHEEGDQVALPGASNPFVLAESDPFATFAADVDTASYDIFRRSLLNGALPPPSEVRVEEYVNYFHYDYQAPAPISDLPFSIALAAGNQLTAAPTKLLRVGIQASTQEKRPINVVFLVDISGSMATPNKLPLVQTVLHEALTLLAPDDHVSIVTYAGGTRVAYPAGPARERAQIDAAIDALYAEGGTNGASGIELAYQQAERGLIEEGINHVVLCTDGDFNLGVTSNEALVALIEQKRKSGVTLTALGFGERNNDAMMERVSNAGNGIYSVLYNEDQAIAYTHRRLLSSMQHVAKDVKIQLELNPAHVHAYRLLGFENRQIADQQFRSDAVDAGEIGAGHQVTALFELAMKPSDLPPDLTPSPGDRGGAELMRSATGDVLASVRIRFKRPGAGESEPAREVVASLLTTDLVEDVSQLDPDATWAMGVASLAEQLRGSPHARGLDLARLHDLLAPLVGTSAERAELLELLARVGQLQGSIARR